MSNNIGTTSTNDELGKVLATDEIAGVHYPIGKLAFGGEDTAVDPDTNSGNKSAGTLRVVLATDQPQLTNALKVDGSAVTQPVSGTITVQDGGSTISIDDNGGSLTIDGSVSITGTVDTELPAAASLADATANPSTTSVGALNLLYNGTTWDRVRGDTTNGIDVDVTRVQGSVTVVDGGGAISVDDNGVSLTVDNTTLSVTGGGVEATALRVTIASDSTGVLSVDDNGSTLSIDDGGGSLTVDGTVAVSGTVTVADANLDNTTLVDNAGFTDGTTRVQMAGYVFDDVAGTALTENDAAAARIDSKRAQVGVIEDRTTRGRYAGVSAANQLQVSVDATQGVAIDTNGGNKANGTFRVTLATDQTTLTNVFGTVRVGDGTNTATIRDLASNDALNVAIVDGSGNQITSFGGGTEYTEDAAAAADPVGKATILVRQDTPATITSTNGDNVAQRGTNYGAAYTQIVTSAGAFVDTFGGGTQYTEGDTDATITGTAMLWEDTSDTLRAVSAAKPLPIGDAGGSLTVDGSVTSLGSFKTCTTDVTRPADTTAYAINDALSNSTSAPTAGGFTFTDAARVSGGSGIITDAIVTTSADAATLLQGEIWVFDQAVTNINDNAAFAVSDTEIKTCVGKIPFTLEDAGNNGFYHATNLSIGFTCVGTADLRFLVRVKNAYTPASAEVLTFVIKVLRVD